MARHLFIAMFSKYLSRRLFKFSDLNESVNLPSTKEAALLNMEEELKLNISEQFQSKGR